MKNILLTILGLIIFCGAKAQEAYPIKWEATKLKSKADYKAAESNVKECVDYLLANPYSNDDHPARCAGRLLARWMEGTKDYHFSIQSNISKYYTSQNMLIVIYMAALTKLGFDSPDILADKQKTEIEAFKIYAKYCDDPSHKVEQTEAITKLIKAYKANKLADVLDLDFAKKGK